jgi:uncharacterized protein (DUF2147 family)
MERTHMNAQKIKHWQHRTAAGFAAVSAAVFILTDAGLKPAFAAPREAGIWYDDSGQGAVEIVPCGDKLCGRIVWLKDPLNAEGRPKMDRYNPKPENRERQICGLQVIGGLQRMDDGGWDTGWIYDPKQGTAYDLAIALVAKDQLQITGYKGLKLLSKTFMWTRAPAELPRCDATGQQDSAAPPAAKPEKKKKVAKDTSSKTEAGPVGAEAGAVPKPVPAKRPAPDAAAQ